MAIAKLILITCVCGALALPLATGCSYNGRNVGQKELTKILGGDQVVAVLRKPDKVKAALLLRPDDDHGTDATPDQFKLASEELSVSSDAAARIANAIVDPRSNLQLSAGKGCMPSYEVRFTYVAGKDRVDLYLCFACDFLMVYLNGNQVGGSHIDNVHQTLIREALALFPDNAGLLELANR